MLHLLPLFYLKNLLPNQYVILHNRKKTNNLIKLNKIIHSRSSINNKKFIHWIFHKNLKVIKWKEFIFLLLLHAPIWISKPSHHHSQRINLKKMIRNINIFNWMKINSNLSSFKVNHQIIWKTLMKLIQKNHRPPQKYSKHLLSITIFHQRKLLVPQLLI